VRAVQVSCLFWNAYRKDLRELVAEAAARYELDIVILIEPGADPDATLRSLRDVDASFFEAEATSPRFQLFARRPDFDLTEVVGDASSRLTIRLLKLGDLELLLAAVHFPSKISHWDSIDQAAEAVNLSGQIRVEESQRGHRRTIVVGDFNMNPFEPGLIQANSFHAVMTVVTAKAGSRKVQGRGYPFFYNPMWSFFGDRTSGPPGTHYFRAGGKPVSYDWNMFDQVLVRPDALKWFEVDVEIPTAIGDFDLRDRHGRPNRNLASDHFPVLFRLSSIS